MGLFDKKECSICGGDIGLFGNRKLADGNCCKECAKLLSPYLTDRRGSTVKEIREHLAYRAANKQALALFHPTKVFGSGTKVYLDENRGMLIVTEDADWQHQNPDLISVRQVIGVRTDVREDRIEEYRTTRDGKNVPYNPPRYRYSYNFYTTLQLDSPWFNEITFELSGDAPHSRQEQLYRSYEMQAEELAIALQNAAAAAPAVQPVPAAPADGWKCACGTVNTGKFCVGCGAKKPEPKPEPQDETWKCKCGAVNNGNFCPNCGAKKPEKASYRCSRCGWVPEDPAHPPKFCPNCGDPFNKADRV